MQVLNHIEKRGHGVNANKLVRKIAGLGKAVVMVGWCLVGAEGTHQPNQPPCKPDVVEVLRYRRVGAHVGP